MDGKETSSAPEHLRSDLFTGGLGEKKNVKEWVKNGESTAEAKELALTLQAKMEAIKKETNLKLVQEYRYVFDELIMSPDSYDAKSTTVDDVYKNKGLIYVLEKNCPVLAVQFQTYPDLRYLVYANLTKQVPDVDVLPMNSTVSMVDGMIQLSRPGKPDVSFKLFPWDYREAIEARYQALKPAPEKTPEAVAAPAPEPDKITSDFFKEEEDDLVIPVGAPPVPLAPAVEPKLETKEVVSPVSDAFAKYVEADGKGDADSALSALREARRLKPSEELKTQIVENIDRLEKQFGKVEMKGDISGATFSNSLPEYKGMNKEKVKTYIDFARQSLESTGKFEGLLPLGYYGVTKNYTTTQFHVENIRKETVSW